MEHMHTQARRSSSHLKLEDTEGDGELLGLLLP
jgi:hypothetical protein